MLRGIGLGAAVAFVLGAPAHATLQVALNIGPDNFFCADNQACDTNPAVGVIQVADAIVDGVQVNGSIQASVLGGGGVFPSLNTSSLSLINLNGTASVATVAVGDTGFQPVAAKFHSAGAGTWQGPGGSSVILSWFIDPGDGQGAADAFDTPGALIDSFSNAALSPTSSFSHDGMTDLSLVSPFSMTEQATVVLASSEALINRGQAIVGAPIPEASTWAMLAAGFALMGFAGLRRRQTAGG